MSIKSFFCLAISLSLFACNGGFEKFVPPANSISGRGAKVNPKILTSTPADNATVSPVTDSNGTRIVVVFDMSMQTAMVPVVNTYVRDVGSGNSVVWLAVANSGATFTWSSTNYANDTLTIQLGWVRWPENNIIGFDFDNSTLVNLDEMPLSNENKLSFTVGWNPGRYKVVQTGQNACYRDSTGSNNWVEEISCLEGGAKLGTPNYPAGQNGLIEPVGQNGIALYGAGSGGATYGRRFLAPENPMNVSQPNCNFNSSDACYPYSLDTVTTLMWRTCSQGQYYGDHLTPGQKCSPAAGSDFTWGQAVNSCAALNTADSGQGYAGRRDWRLPTIEELENLPDYGKTCRDGLAEPTAGYVEGPAIDGYQPSGLCNVREGAFPDTPTSKGYWTATGVAARLSGQTYYADAHVVEFQKGAMGYGGGTGALLESGRKTSNRKKVRCVAGPGVAPVAQNLVTSVQGAGAALGGNAASFVGFDSSASFNINSANATYDIQANQYTIRVEYNKPPNSTQAGTAANYCIAAANSVAACAVSSPSIATALPDTGNFFKLTLGAATVTNSAYKLIVTGVTSASDQWQTATAYNTNTYLSDSGNVYQVLANHTSGATVAGDVGLGNLVLLAQFAASTVYTINTKLYVASLGVVVNVQSGYTSTASAQNDINSGFLQSVKTLLITPPQALSVSRVFFNGPPTRVLPATNTVFNVVSATSPNLTSVQVNFNRLPNAASAVVTGNYCIISPTANPWSCAAPLAAVTAASLSNYTVTLTANVAAGTPYVVLVSGVSYLGSQVVDDAVNKLRWQRCRKGLLDNGTCADDGDSTNDTELWKNALNYCDYLNMTRYDNDANTSTSLRYGWRAPTVNELRSLVNRSLFGTVGVSIDTTIFPSPNVTNEDFASSTNMAFNGNPAGVSPSFNPPAYNKAWAFRFLDGVTSLAPRDNFIKKNIRCVRGLP